MVSAKNNSSNPLSVLMKELQKLLSWQVLIGLLIMLVITAHLRLWVDRYTHTHFFPQQSYRSGIYETLWWGITMLVTWETPKSRGLARIIDLSWHFMGLIGLSIMTAIVTAALTSQAISGSIQSEKDLPNKRVAAVATDAPRHYLEKIEADVVPVKNLQEGMQLLLNEEVDALVHDGPRLSYLSDKANAKAHKKVLMVLPSVFNQQNYGIVFPQDSVLRESINKALLRLRENNGSDISFHKSLKNKWIPAD
jgi:ABC-type amino acid transport substrate-binding protein